MMMTVMMMIVVVMMIIPPARRSCGSCRCRRRDGHGVSAANIVRIHDNDTHDVGADASPGRVATPDVDDHAAFAVVKYGAAQVRKCAG
jgi:hypothetical protein